MAERKDGGGAEVRIGGAKGRQCQLTRVSGRQWTAARRQAFLDSLAQTCNVTMAVAAAGMGTTAVYQLRKTDPAFAGLWQEALALGYERLETALLQHALVGVNALEVRAVSAEDAAPGVAEAEAAGDTPASNDRAEPARRGHPIPGSGIAPDTLTPVQVQVALAMLNRRDAALRSGGVPRGLRRATLAEAETALTRALDGLARQKARSAESRRLAARRDGADGGADGAA